jgi:NAD(P)-dependent dehydrogenase (short-subunit alcohol dehydrogenase family)
MPRLEGKIAVITGGSSGIGLATAKRFVKEGADVFITGRRQAELDKAVAEIGSNVTAVKGDVANPSDLDRLYQTVGAKKGKGIRANMVSPGPIETPLLEGQFVSNIGAMKDRLIAMTPMQRIGRPEEIASAVLFLASDESSYITGIDLPVDGGTVAL